MDHFSGNFMGFLVLMYEWNRSPKDLKRIRPNKNAGDGVCGDDSRANLNATAPVQV